MQFQLFQIPFVGADTCGFSAYGLLLGIPRLTILHKDGNSDEELCNRWMQLSAFTPFYRNHNVKGAIPQEPYRWDSVANASRTAIAIRYAMLPYWVWSLYLLVSFLTYGRYSILYSQIHPFEEPRLSARFSSNFRMSGSCSMYQPSSWLVVIFS